MCGRITQTSGELPGLVTIMGDNRDSCIKDPKDWVRYNGAPSQEFWIIRNNRKTNAFQRDRLTWGLIPHWVTDRTGGRKPINAKAESVVSLPVIIARDHYERWLMNIDPDPRDLLVPYPAEVMTMWPISTRVNKPDNDDPAILDRVDE